MTQFIGYVLPVAIVNRKYLYSTDNKDRELCWVVIFVVLVDSENALDETWLQALDVDTDEKKLLERIIKP